MTVASASEAGGAFVRVRAWVVLGAAVTLVTTLHAVLALGSPSPWIMPDELRYAELAKSLGEGGLPRIRDEVTFGFGLGYPALLAPIWALFDDVSTAYQVAKVLNALVLGLTAVPAYLLARRFLDEMRALAAAILTISVPSLAYAGALMTEVVLYPTFVLAVLAITVALERPTPARQAAAFVAIALASIVKILAATLFVGYIAAILLYHWLGTRRVADWRARLRAYRPTWIALTAAGVAVLGMAAVLGRSPTVALGAYKGIVSDTDFLAVPWWTFLHIAEFDLYVAVIPFAVTVLVIASGLRRGVNAKTRLLAAVALSISLPLFVAVAVYSSDSRTPEFGYVSGAGANERSTFILAPLFFIAFMMWLRERPGTRRSVLAAGLGAALLPVAIPLESYDELGNVVVQAFALVPWVGLGEHSIWPFDVSILTLGLGSFLVLAWRRGMRDVALVAPVAAVLVAVMLIAQAQLQLSSEWSRSVAFGKSPDWIDTAAGGERVSVLWYERPGKRFVLDAARHRVLWLSEFFNRQVGPVYELGSPVAFGFELPSTPVRLERARVILENGALAPLGALILAPCHVHVRGRVVARDTRTGAVLHRISGVAHVTVAEPGSCPGRSGS